MNIKIMALAVFSICTIAYVYLEIKGKDNWYYGYGAFISFFAAIDPGLITNL